MLESDDRTGLVPPAIKSPGKTPGQAKNIFVRTMQGNQITKIYVQVTFYLATLAEHQEVAVRTVKVVQTVVAEMTNACQLVPSSTFRSICKTTLSRPQLTPIRVGSGG